MTYRLCVSVCPAALVRWARAAAQCRCVCVSPDSLASLLDGGRLAAAGCAQDPSAVSFSRVPMPPQTDPQSPYYRRSRHAPLYTPNLESKYPAARLRRDRNRTLPDDVDTTQLEVGLWNRVRPDTRRPAGWRVWGVVPF